MSNTTTVGRMRGSLSTSDLGSYYEPMAMNRSDVAGVACDDESCPVARAVRSLDGKWTLLIVRDLLGGTRRFGELRSSRSRREWSTRSRRPVAVSLR